MSETSNHSKQPDLSTLDPLLDSLIEQVRARHPECHKKYAGTIHPYEEHALHEAIADLFVNVCISRGLTYGDANSVISHSIPGALSRLSLS